MYWRLQSSSHFEVLTSVADVESVHCLIATSSWCTTCPPRCELSFHQQRWSYASRSRDCWADVRTLAELIWGPRCLSLLMVCFKLISGIKLIKRNVQINMSLQNACCTECSESNWDQIQCDQVWSETCAELFCHDAAGHPVVVSGPNLIICYPQTNELKELLMTQVEVTIQIKKWTKTSI